MSVCTCEKSLVCPPARNVISLAEIQRGKVSISLLSAMEIGKQHGITELIKLHLFDYDIKRTKSIN